MNRFRQATQSRPITNRQNTRRNEFPLSIGGPVQQAISAETVLQKISTPMTRAAIFLVVTVNPDEANATAVNPYAPIFQL